MLKDNTIKGIENSIDALQLEINKLKEQLEILKEEAAKEEKWLSAAEAEEIYPVKSSAFRKAINDGRLAEGIDCKKVGKTWLFLKSSLDNLYNK